MSEPVVRLHLFFATQNNTAVILRQGPTKQFRLILWHRDTDAFEDGQWLKHKVYVERCDLSPDGSHFIYFVLDGKWSADTQGSYTVISRPPYFTALALFPQGDTWGGGGVFLDDVHYYAHGGADIIGRDQGLSRISLGEPSKGCTTGIRLQNGQRAPLDRAATRRLLDEPKANDIYELHNRMAVPRGDLLDRYDTLGGKLYHRRGENLELIRDFTDMSFEEVIAPYDWRHDPEDPSANQHWHPLGGGKE
jgi:hypothetical protein